MSDFNKNTPVFLTECKNYDVPALTSLLRDSFAALGITDSLISGKKVLLKPNLVLAKKPELAATTHPSFIEALVNVCCELGAASVTLADSPGGPYNAAALAVVYKTCGMDSIADKRLTLNQDFTFDTVNCSGVKLKSFHIINAVRQADVVIDVCKLKTHSLTGMSCAVKNLFGIIPGVEKFEMHSGYPEIPDFSEMLVDLAEYMVKNKTFIAVCDGVLSMEGNGPTHGVPKKTDLLLVSRSPFALDVTAEHIMKLDGEVLHLDCAAQRNLVPRSFDGISLIGQWTKENCPRFDFTPPDTSAGKFLRNLPNFMGGRLAKLFETKPEILKKKCIGCGKCVSSCPMHTITVETLRNGKKRAKIHRGKCIRCYCCQELCPIGAVGTKQNLLIKLIH
ncbi:MAG: DUF362 domain-containing protein [Clostridia bacterium]|nr:DUF362 domain-containing protein [Clostridia bacterium]